MIYLLFNYLKLFLLSISIPYSSIFLLSFHRQTDCGRDKNRIGISSEQEGAAWHFKLHFYSAIIPSSSEHGAENDLIWRKFDCNASRLNRFWAVVILNNTSCHVDQLNFFLTSARKYGIIEEELDMEGLARRAEKTCMYAGVGPKYTHVLCT